MMLEDSRRGRVRLILVLPHLICIACSNAWTRPINWGAMLCFGCKLGEGGCHIFWFAWYENSGGLQSIEPVVYLGWNEIFYWDVCISMQFSSFIVADPGASLLDFTVNLSWGQYKSRKWIWLFIYMHSNRHTRFWWLSEWRSQLAICVGAWYEGRLSDWFSRGRGGLPTALHVTAMENIPKVFLHLCELMCLCLSRAGQVNVVLIGTRGEDK